MKREKERKKRNIWYVIGGIAFVAGMFVVMPKGLIINIIF